MDYNGVEVLIESLAGLHFQNIPCDYNKDDDNIVKTYNFSDVLKISSSFHMLKKKKTTIKNIELKILIKNNSNII